MTETIIYKSRPSWLNYLGLYLLCGLLFLVLAIAGVPGTGILVCFIVFLVAAFSRARYLFTVTDHRVVMRKGLIANNTNEMSIRHIRGINVRQGVVERLLGIGTMEILSAAESGAEVIFTGIHDPHSIKEVIQQMRIY